MRLPPFEFFGPTSMDETLSLLAAHGPSCAVIGGGTEVMGRMKHRLLKPACVVSLKGVDGLSGLRRTNGHVSIGAMTTLRELAESALLGEVAAALSESARAVAAPPIQNVATIGGNILQNTRCLFYNQSELVRKGREPCLKAGGTVCYAVPGSKRCFSVYQGDIAPALVAFGASVRLDKQGGSRTLPVGELFSGDARQPLRIGADELLTEIVVPIPAGSGSSYKKLRMRASVDYALAAAAAVLTFDGDLVRKASLVLGAAGPAPRAVDAAVPLMEGRSAGQVDVDAVAELAVKASECIDNLALPGAYRRDMIRVFARRALTEVLNNVGKGTAK